MIFPETEDPHEKFAQRHAPGAATRRRRFWGYGPLIVRCSAALGGGGAHHADGSGLGSQAGPIDLDLHLGVVAGLSPGPCSVCIRERWESGSSRRA